MTVDELIDRLSICSQFGHGKQQVKIYDPNSEQAEEVTGVKYGNGKVVELYSDED